VLCTGPTPRGGTGALLLWSSLSPADYDSHPKDGSWWVSESSSTLRRTSDPQILLHGIPPCSPHPDGGCQIESFLNKEITPNVFCRFSSLQTDEIGNPKRK